MAKRLRNSQGAVVALELSEHEMALVLGVEAEELQSWPKIVAPYAKAKGEAIYRVRDADELGLVKKRVGLLRTRMSEDAVASVEEAGLLDAYAALAADCPPGITVHVWRSYAIVVLMQVRYGKMLDAEELARRAGLALPDGKPDVAMAKKHLRLLVGIGKLRVGKKVSKDEDWTGQWHHQGLPEAFQSS
jgi:hypothetical protein